MKNEKSVFISYSSRDTEQVNKIVNLLKDTGISYFKAPEMIPVGSNYAREIPRVICECKVFLLIITEESQKSIWVEKEIDYAINNNKIIVPIKMCAGKLNGLFEFYLNNVQMIEYNEDGERAIYILREKLLSIINMKNDDDVSDISVKDNINDISDGKKKLDINGGLNPQPVKCKYCGGELINVSVGKYRCVKCKNMNFDYFQTVRNYLDMVGAASILVIEKDTSVPRASIEYFLKNELLEIPKNCSIRLVCEGCGTPIRTGRLCDRCKSMGIKVKKDSSEDKYTMLRKKGKVENGKKYLGDKRQ